MPVTIVIADDHAMVRAGLRTFLDAARDLRVVGEAEDGQAALRVVEELQPQLLVADFDMPPPTGIELARMLHSRQSRTLVAILTMYNDRSLATEAKRAGAAGFVTKRARPQELIEAIRTVALDGAYWPDDNTDPLTEAHEEHSPLEALTDAERELLRLIASGQTSAKIEQTLGQPREAVERSRQALMSKLGLRDRASLVSFAHDHGLM